MPIADPVFILAPPRCFTTVVSAMLGQHPQMYGLPETYLFTSRTMREWWTMNEGSDRVDGLLRAVAEIVSGSQTIATIDLARDWLHQRSDQSTSDIFLALAERVFPLTLIEKTPKAAERIEYLAMMAGDFPKARFIHLLRHPVGHVRSRLERRFKQFKKPGRAQRHDLVTVAKRFGSDPQMLWYRCNRNILTFLESVPVGRQMCVRGEDLLAEPDQNLRRISEWLGLRSDPMTINQMKHPERSPFARFGPRNAVMGGDEKFFREPTLHGRQNEDQSLESPLPWRRDQAGFRPEVQELARQFGYR